MQNSNSRNVFTGDILQYRQWRASLVEAVRAVSGYEIVFNNLPPPDPPILHGLDPTAHALLTQQHRRDTEKGVTELKKEF